MFLRKFGLICLALAVVPVTSAQEVTTEWDRGSGELTISFEQPRRGEQLSDEEIRELTYTYVIDFLVGEVSESIRAEIDRLEDKVPGPGVLARLGLKARKDQAKKDVVSFLRLRFTSMMELGEKLDRVIEFEFEPRPGEREKRKWYSLKRSKKDSVVVPGLTDDVVSRLKDNVAEHYFQYVTHYDSLKSAFELIATNFSESDKKSFQQAVTSDLRKAGVAEEHTVTLNPSVIYRSAERGHVPPDVADELVFDYAMFIREKIKEGLDEVAGGGVEISEPVQQDPEIRHDRFDLVIDIDLDPHDGMLQAILDGRLALWRKGEDRLASKLSFSRRKNPGSTSKLTVTLGLERPFEVPLSGSQLVEMELRFLGEYAQYNKFLINPRVENLVEWVDVYSKEFFYTVSGYPGDLNSFVNSVKFRSQLKPDPVLETAFLGHQIEIIGLPQNRHFITPDSKFKDSGIELVIKVRLDEEGLPFCAWYQSLNEALSTSFISEVEKGKGRPLTRIRWESSHWIEGLEREGAGSLHLLKQRSDRLIQQEVKVASNTSWVFLKCVPEDQEQAPLYWFLNLHAGERPVRLNYR